MKLRRFCPFLLPLILLGKAALALQPMEPMELLTADPWTAQILRFIGGPFVSIRSLEDWHETGRLSVSRRMVALFRRQEIPLIAFDPLQAKAMALTSSGDGAHKKLYFLYERAPIEGLTVEQFYNDPAHLPFVAQQALILLSRLDPSNYGFYQRRLGEFETRLHSTIFSGRLLLKDAKILDIGGLHSLFLTSVGCQVQRPRAEELELWAAMMEERDPKIRAKKAEQLAQDQRIFLLDYKVDPKLRELLVSLPNSVELLPSGKGDFLLYLHESFLQIGNALRRLGRL